VKIYSVENGFLSQSDYQQGVSLSKTSSSIIPFPHRAVYCKNLFSQLYVVAATRRRKAKKTNILPFRYREKDLLVVGDAILEALPLSHLFTGLIHPSAFQKPVTMGGKKTFRNICLSCSCLIGVLGD